jgi:hypothetical protein
MSTTNKKVSLSTCGLSQPKSGYVFRVGRRQGVTTCNLTRNGRLCGRRLVIQSERFATLLDPVIFLEA